MGKEGLYWGGWRSTKRGRGGERESSSTSGCMSVVLQLFDFHLFQFDLHQPPPSFKRDSFLPEEPAIRKGVEAPRNSLEMQEPFMGATLLSSTMEGGENLNIPMGMQIKTNCDTTTRSSKARADDLSSEVSSSPVIKTPNLVARLMGLDLLPENCSPSLPSSTSNPQSKLHLHPKEQIPKQEAQSRLRLRSIRLDTDIMGTRSLPETPRMSSERRSDVDHRLSVQINKENNDMSEEEVELSRSRRRDMKLEDEIKSPRRYARQIMKQVRESVSRKVGLDITNTIRNRELVRDEHDVLRKKKQTKASIAKLGNESSPSKQSTPSCSPRLRFLEPKNRTVTSTVFIENQTSHIPKLSSSPSSYSLMNNRSRPSKVSWKPMSQQLQVQQQQNSVQNCEKASTESFTQRLKKPRKTLESIRNKQEEPFVRSFTTKRANQSDKNLSSDLVNTNVPTLLSVKKDPSPPATKLPQKQYSQVSDALSSKPSTQLSSCSSLCFTHSYKQKKTHTLTIQENSTHHRFNSATTGDEAELQYVSRILERTGIHTSTPVSYTKWYTPSQPLDPSIFHHLEISTTTMGAAAKLSHRSNRKLMFELVNEVLVEVLKPCINLQPWVSSSTINSVTDDREMDGSELIDRVWTKIKSFPLADCRVLEDIDKLMDLGLCDCEVQRSVAFEEEGESIVSEIERDVTDSLVHETAMLVWSVRQHVDDDRAVPKSDRRHMGGSRDEMRFIGRLDPLFSDL